MSCTNTQLFEALLQGIIREMKRVYWNTQQAGWGSVDCSIDCSEWWPDNMSPVVLGDAFTLRIAGDDERWAVINCGGRELTVEISSKRIGMYGPHDYMTDTELVLWFNRAMADLSEFDRTTRKKLGCA
ncbi:MAG TPA: hypothetical protein VKX49_12470 [Bryobacteraceae bacterium]|nr:hypothetical protein [Bryobacteraceae bacterium]